MKHLYDFIEQNKLYNNEGSRGVSNLCKIVRAIGYKDPMRNGELSQGGCLGDLMCFLEDNPGAIEAIITFIERSRVDEWDAELASQMDLDEDDDNEDEEGEDV